MQQLVIDDLTINVIRKKIRNTYLRINASTGAVQISAPLKISETALHQFVASKIAWIRKCLNNQVQVIRPLSYESGEYHYFQGLKYCLNVIASQPRNKVHLRSPYLDLYLRTNTEEIKRKSVLDKWYREQLMETAAHLIEKWERIIGVKITEFNIKKMKTKWGTCNPSKKRIWLSLELAKKPLHCLEYVVVHELVHLLERGHNRRFYAFMDHFLTDWRAHKKELNLAMRHS